MILLWIFIGISVIIIGVGTWRIVKSESDDIKRGN